MNLSIEPPPPKKKKHRLSYEPFNLAPPPPPPPKLILSIIRWFLALDCLPAKSKTKLKLCYASFRDEPGLLAPCIAGSLHCRPLSE